MYAISIFNFGIHEGKAFGDVLFFFYILFVPSPHNALNQNVIAFSRAQGIIKKPLKLPKNETENC